MDEHHPNEAATLPSSSDFKQLVEQANAGDAAALKQLKQLLDENPAVWQRVGDLALHAERVLIDVITGGEKLMSESLKRSLQDLKAQLAGPDPSPLERLTVERITSCWLALQHVETMLIKTTPGSHEAAFLLKRQAQADRAYQAALKSLTTVRQLLPNATVGDRRAGSGRVEPTAGPSVDRSPIFPMHQDQAPSRRQA